MHRRMLAAVAAAVLSVAGLSLAGPAVAATPPTCSGTACLVVAPAETGYFAAQGAATTVGWTIDVRSGQARLRFAAHQTSGLTPRAGTASFDGHLLPASAVAITGHDITLNLTSFSPVAVGEHQVQFGVRMAATAVTDQTATGAATFDDTLGSAPATATSTAVTVRLDKPDFSIFSAEGPYNQITAGNIFGFSLDVDGPANVPSRLLLRIPAGFSFVKVEQGNDNRKLHCGQNGSLVSCSDVDYSKDRFLGVTLRANSNVRIGTRGSVIASIAPVGVPDATPANNTRSVSFFVVGTVGLKVAVTSPYGLRKDGKFVESTFLPIGKPTVLTLTVTNQGPNVATGVSAGFSMETNTADYFHLDFGRGITGQQSRAHQFANGIWRIGDIPVGQTAVSTITVTPKRFGDRATLGLYMKSNELNTLECDSRACLSSGGIGIEVVKAAAVTSSPVPPASGTDAGTDPTLAATGSPVRAPLVAGLLSLLAGAVLMMTGRRRRA